LTVKPYVAPRFWGAHALLLVVVAATVLLGLWQWDVAHDRKDQRAAELAHAAPVPLTSVMGNNDPFPGDDVGRPVTVSGTWIPSGMLRIVNGDGYWLAAPLQVDGTDAAVYVVLGQTAGQAVPAIGVSGEATVTGWLEASQDSGQVDADLGDDVLPEMRIADAVSHVDVDLYSAFVISEQPAPGLQAAHLTVQPQTPFTTGLRNLLYAVQWWLFTAFAVFIWWRWLREQDEVAPASGAQDEAVPSGS
jgi:cytochrome oxidase assembly protein ShyY1